MDTTPDSDPIRIDWPPVPIYADTWAEVERVKLFREAFLERLLEEPRVITRLEHWGTTTGLLAAAQGLAAATDEEAVSAGCTALDQACARLESLADDGVTLLRDELHLPWAGVGGALLQTLCERVWAVIYGDGSPPTASLEIEISDPPAPNFRWSFRKRAGETEREIVARFVEEANEAYGQLIAACQIQGHVEVGRSRTQEVPRYALWCYEHIVGGTSVRALAQQHHNDRQHPRAFSKCDCRSTVAAGIKQAKRRMDLAFPPQQV